ELKRAAELAPSQPGPWLGMVGIYVRQDQRELALKAMEEGSKRLSGGQKDLFLGQCYEVLGEKGKAEAAYLAATIKQSQATESQLALVNFYLRNARKNEAKRELQVLLGQKDLKIEIACWARRNLAVLTGDEDAKVALDL